MFKIEQVKEIMVQNKKNFFRRFCFEVVVEKKQLLAMHQIQSLTVLTSLKRKKKPARNRNKTEK
jgi:hypothetical protein